MALEKKKKKGFIVKVKQIKQDQFGSNSLPRTHISSSDAITCQRIDLNLVQYFLSSYVYPQLRVRSIDLIQEYEYDCLLLKITHTRISMPWEQKGEFQHPFRSRRCRFVLLNSMYRTSKENSGPIPFFRILEYRQSNAP